jgi:hypothetical protein
MSAAYSSCQRDLLESINHSEALPVLSRHRHVTRSVNDQRLHACGNRGLHLLDIVAKEQNLSRRQLNHKKVSTSPHSKTPKKNVELTFNSIAILS